MLFTTTFRPSLCLFLRLKKEIHEIQSGVREQWRQQGRVMHTGVDRETPYLNFKIIPAFDRSQNYASDGVQPLQAVWSKWILNWRDWRHFEANEWWSGAFLGSLKQMNAEVERLKAFWIKWVMEWNVLGILKQMNAEEERLKPFWIKGVMEWSVCRHFEANECRSGEIEGILNQISDGVERL